MAPERATKLAQEIAARHDPGTKSVHLVGHSTGGLDIRLLLSPGGAVDAGGASVASMGEGRAAIYADALAKVRSAIGVATPHCGAPVADFAVRHALDVYLREVGPLVDNAIGRGAITAGLAGAGALSRLVRALPGNGSFLDWISEDVLEGKPDDVLDFLHGIGEDAGALRNLTHVEGDERVSGWVESGADFRGERFELMWERVARFMASASGVKLNEPIVSRSRAREAA